MRGAFLNRPWHLYSLPSLSLFLTFSGDHWHSFRHHQLIVCLSPSISILDSRFPLIISTSILTHVMSTTRVNPSNPTRWLTLTDWTVDGFCCRHGRSQTISYSNRKEKKNETRTGQTKSYFRRDTPTIREFRRNDNHRPAVENETRARHAAPRSETGIVNPSSRFAEGHRVGDSTLVATGPKRLGPWGPYISSPTYTRLHAKKTRPSKTSWNKGLIVSTTWSSMVTDRSGNPMPSLTSPISTQISWRWTDSTETRMSETAKSFWRPMKLGQQTVEILTHIHLQMSWSVLITDWCASTTIPCPKCRSTDYVIYNLHLTYSSTSLHLVEASPFWSSGSAFLSQH